MPEANLYLVSGKIGGSVVHVEVSDSLGSEEVACGVVIITVMRPPVLVPATKSKYSTSLLSAPSRSYNNNK